MTERVLFVDDEPNVLEAIQRTLRKHVDLQTASSGAAGLRVLNETGPFALVISDMRMPSMNGAQFLAKVREKSPDTVRMILSGQADLQATIDAVTLGMGSRGIRVADRLRCDAQGTTPEGRSRPGHYG
jgi:DNA-binding NtrC family response regulator